MNIQPDLYKPAILRITGLLVFCLLCRQLAAQPCIDPRLIDKLVLCPFQYQPVCGCDGKTYVNDCVARYTNGVSSWSEGPCDADPCPTILPGFISKTQGGNPYTLSFTDTTVIYEGGINSWFWDFGDGTSSTLPDPTHTYSQAGFYTVCLTVVAATGITGALCTDKFCAVVEVKNDCLDACPFSIEYTLDGTLLHARLLPGPPPGNIIWQLQGSNQLYKGEEFVETLSGKSRYVLCATYQEPQGGVCTECKGIVAATPCIDPAKIDTTIGCIEIYKPVCGCDGNTYENACIAGRHGLTSWKPGACGSVCNELNVELSGFNSGGSLTVYTFNADVYFPGGKPVSWEWDFGNGTTSNEPGPTLNFLQPGVYNVCLTLGAQAANGSYCEHTVCDSIKVAGTFCIDPSLIDTTTGCFAIYDPVCGCDGNTYDNSCEALYHHGVTSWTPGPCPNACYDASWTNPATLCDKVYFPVCGCDGKTYENPCSALYHNGITSWTPGACCTAPPACKALFSVERLSDRLVRVIDASINAESWLLTFGDGTQHAGGFDTLLHEYAQPGQYAICLEISNFAGSCTDRFCTGIDFTTSTHSPSRPISTLLLVAPNPASHLVQVYTQESLAYHYQLVDTQGRTLLDAPVSGRSFSFNVSGLPAGMYILYVQTDMGIQLAKLIVH